MTATIFIHLRDSKVRALTAGANDLGNVYIDEAALISSNPDDYDRVAAACVTAANLLRVARGEATDDAAPETTCFDCGGAIPEGIAECACGAVTA